MMGIAQNRIAYEMWRERYQKKILGVPEKLTITSGSAKIPSFGKRKIYHDPDGKQWIKCDGLWWKYPEQMACLAEGTPI